MRCPPIAARLICAPRTLRTCDEATPLCEQIQHEPTASDLVIDLSGVASFGPDAAHTLRDNIFWRIHWSRVGCVVIDSAIAATLAGLHLDRVAAFGSTYAEVVGAMLADPRPPAGGHQLIMGPGPVAAA